MEITEIFRIYTEKMTQIHLYQRAVKESAKVAQNKLEDFIQSLQSKPELKKHTDSYHGMAFEEAQSGKHYFFGRSILSLKDRQEQTIIILNKQYQWLLAEAYEAFEDFVEQSYAFLGYSDRNQWPLEDFGKITFDELEICNFSWFVSQANNVHRKRDLLKDFRNKYPELIKLESENHLKVNLRFMITMIEKLRHIIVHNGGRTADKKKFLKGILEKTGVYNNGNFDSEYSDWIDFLIGSGRLENTVILLELPTKTNIPFYTYVDVFGKLSGYLMAYAHIIFVCIQENFETSKRNASPLS